MDRDTHIKNLEAALREIAALERSSDPNAILRAAEIAREALAANQEVPPSVLGCGNCRGHHANDPDYQCECPSHAPAQVIY